MRNHQEPKQFQTELQLVQEHRLAAPVRCANSRHCQGLVSGMLDQLADCADRLLQARVDGRHVLQRVGSVDGTSLRELKCPRNMFGSKNLSPKVALRGGASLPLLYQP